MVNNKKKPRYNLWNVELSGGGGGVCVCLWTDPGRGSPELTPAPHGKHRGAGCCPPVMWPGVCGRPRAPTHQFIKASGRHWGTQPGSRLGRCHQRSRWVASRRPGLCSRAWGHHEGQMAPGALTGADLGQIWTGRSRDGPTSRGASAEPGLGWQGSLSPRPALRTVMSPAEAGPEFHT